MATPLESPTLHSDQPGGPTRRSGCGHRRRAPIPAWASSNIMKQAVTFLTLLALAQMWNLLAGYAGLISVGQQAFVGIGAYALWVFSEKLGIHPFLCVPIAGVVAAILAVPTAGLAFRLRGGYFAVGTWVIAEVYRLLVTQISWLGGGSGVSMNSVGQIDRSTREAAVFWYALGVAVGSIALVYFLLRSRRGLALTAIRDEETGARGLGVNVLRSKLWVYVIAAFGTGAIGAVIYLNLLRVHSRGQFWAQLERSHDLRRGHRRPGDHRGPHHRGGDLLRPAAVAADYGTWYLILLGAVAALVVVFARRGLWGSLVYRRAIDLFPVRRRLCLETVCFPEEAPSPEPPAAGGDEPRAPVGTTPSEPAPPAPQGIARPSARTPGGNRNDAREQALHRRPVGRPGWSRIAGSRSSTLPPKKRWPRWLPGPKPTSMRPSGPPPGVSRLQPSSTRGTTGAAASASLAAYRAPLT